MAALISGLLESFDLSKYNVTRYIQRFKLFMKANDIPEERKKSVFLTAIGYDSYEILANIFEKLEQETLETLEAELEKHFNSKSSVIAERYKFGRHQKESESIPDFVPGLRKLAACCNFKKASLDETLCDKFVCGLQQEYIRSCLLTEEDNLIFDRSVEIATGLEGAKKHAHLMQQETKKEEDHRTTRRHNTFNPRSSTIVCFCCGGPHVARACRFIKEKCHNCGNTVHISKVCRSLTTKSQNSKGRPAKGLDSVNKEESSPLEELTPEESNNLFMIYSFSSRSDPIKLAVEVNGHKLDIELDTGASVFVISEDMFTSGLSSSVQLRPSNASLTSYSGHLLEVLGSANIKVKYQTQTVTLPIFVIKGKGVSLFGCNWLKRIKLDWQIIKSFRINSPLDEVIEKHSRLFRSEVGKLKCMEAKSVSPAMLNLVILNLTHSPTRYVTR